MFLLLLMTELCAQRDSVKNNNILRNKINQESERPNIENYKTLKDTEDTKRYSMFLEEYCQNVYTIQCDL